MKARTKAARVVARDHESFAGRNCVYWIRMTGTNLFKIGQTFHLRQRFTALQTGVPFGLHVFAWVSVPENRISEAEARAHELALEIGEKVNGEWFNLRESQARKTIVGLIKKMGVHAVDHYCDWDIEVDLAK